MLSPSLDIVCAKNLVPAKDKQEEEEDNATEVKLCTTEETTECTDPDLDDMMNINYPFC